MRHHPAGYALRVARCSEIARVPLKDASLCRHRPAPTAAGLVCGIKPARLGGDRLAGNTTAGVGQKLSLKHSFASRSIFA